MDDQEESINYQAIQNLQELQLPSALISLITTSVKNQIQADLTRDEGVIYAIYKDHLGYPTFGIGHLITSRDAEYGKAVGTAVSKARVDAVFQDDLDTHISQTKSLFPDLDKYPGDVQRVLVNMCFNLGKAGLAGFSNFGAAIKKNDWKTAAREGRDSRWYR